jgi:TRAP-type transport system periplasmic protein
MTGALLLYSADHAADIKDRTIKFAFVNYWGAGAEKFAEVVKEKSGGKIKLSPGGVLGGDVQTVTALQGSTIEMAMIGPSQGRRMKDSGPIYRNQISI